MQRLASAAALKGELSSWFLGLSLEERRNVLLWEDKDGIGILKKMYAKKDAQGDGFFFTGKIGEEFALAWS